jgi:hypothetical protein
MQTKRLPLAPRFAETEPMSSNVLDDVLAATEEKLAPSAVDSILDRVDLTDPLLAKGPELFGDKLLLNMLVDRSVTFIYVIDPVTGEKVRTEASIETARDGRVLVPRCKCGKLAACNTVGYELAEVAP